MSTHRFASLAALSLAAALAGCSQPEPEPTTTASSSSSGAADTSSPGDGYVAVHDGVSTPLRLAHHNLVRDGVDADWYAEVVNDGADWICFIRIDDIRFYDAAGTTIGLGSERPVSGSVRKTELGNTSACLGPGELGVVRVPAAETEIDEVAEISFRFATLDVESSPADTELALVGPLTIDSDEDDNTVVSGVIRNVGTEDAVATTVTFRTYLRDADGNYIDWGVETDIASGTAIPVNQPMPVAATSFQSTPADIADVVYLIDWQDPELADL